MMNKRVLATLFVLAKGFSYVHTPNALAVVYEYDPLNQLIRLVHDENTSVEYTYDAAGNMTRKLVVQPPNPDTDLSGIVNFIDLARLAEDWLQPVDHKPGDLNRDDKVDIEDLKIMADYWLEPGEPL